MAAAKKTTKELLDEASELLASGSLEGTPEETEKILKAKGIIDSVLKTNPQHPHALFLSVHYLELQQLCPEARATLDEVIRLYTEEYLCSPQITFSDLYFKRGYQSLSSRAAQSPEGRLKELKESITDFNHALDFRQKDPLSSYCLATALYRTGNFELARFNLAYLMKLMKSTEANRSFLKNGFCLNALIDRAIHPEDMNTKIYENLWNDFISIADRCDAADSENPRRFIDLNRGDTISSEEKEYVKATLANYEKELDEKFPKIPEQITPDNQEKSAEDGGLEKRIPFIFNLNKKIKQEAYCSAEIIYKKTAEQGTVGH